MGTGEGGYRLGKLKRRFVVTWIEGGKRRRFRLAARNGTDAATEFAAFTRQRDRLKIRESSTVADLFEAWCRDRANDGKPTKARRYTWKAIQPTFGPLAPSLIDKGLCRSYQRKQTEAGRAPWTTWTELNLLRTVLRWAEKSKLIDRAPHVWMPATPEPADVHLSREEAGRLIEAATCHHVRLFVILALGTAGRRNALLDLTWDRVDFERGTIDLYDPSQARTAKGRAAVPMNAMLRAALLEAKEGALTPYVIEWAGKKVGSIKRAFVATASAAGIPKATPHVLRHTAAVWQAEDGHSMAEIAQFLGHKDDRITQRVYAKYSPQHLRKLAASVNLDLRKAV